MGLRVAVSDVLEAEGAVIAYEPASKTKEKFRERRVHVEVVLSLDVVRRELSEVHLVEPKMNAVIESHNDTRARERTQLGRDG